MTAISLALVADVAPVADMGRLRHATEAVTPWGELTDQRKNELIHDGFGIDCEADSRRENGVMKNWAIQDSNL